MRLHELFEDDISTEVNRSLKQMFVPWLAQKKEKVPMKLVLDHMRQLHGQDWDVSADWVMDTLDGQSFVKQVTPEEIYLNVGTPESLPGKDTAEKNREHVGKMAKKAIDKR